MSGRGNRRGADSGDLTSEVHKLLDAAAPLFGRGSKELDNLRRRLDGPLRVAIAGKVNAGKSTLLNALVGEKVAPTDATECTRVVTTYRHSHLYRVTATPHQGDPIELRFRRAADELQFRLDPLAVDDVSFVDVEWPTERLRDLVLIDTPGLASVSEDLSLRTQRFLADERGQGAADAVIYLMRHLHEMDLSFLEAFKEGVATGGATVNSIGVISRADEIGSARTNAMDAADRIAAALPRRSAHQRRLPDRHPRGRSHRPGGGHLPPAREQRPAGHRRDGS